MTELRRPGFAAALAWVFLLAGDTGGQIALKLGSGALDAGGTAWDWLASVVANGWVLLGVGCYLCSFVSWLLILRRTALNLAFSLTGLVYVAVLLASRFALHEAVSPARWLGAACIVAGVLLLGPDEA